MAPKKLMVIWGALLQAANFRADPQLKFMAQKREKIEGQDLKVAIETCNMKL